MINLFPFSPFPGAYSGSLEISSLRIGKICKALARAQGQASAAVRTQKATNEKGEEYNYADIFDVNEAIKAAAEKNGLAVVLRFPDGKNSVQGILTHESGQWIDYGIYELGDNKTHQDRGASITFATRRIMRAVFRLPDRDDDATAARPVKAPDAAASYEEYKAGFKIAVPFTDEGQNLDGWGGVFEQRIVSAKNINDLSMLKKANSLTLDQVRIERPDLYAYLEGLLTARANQLK